MTAAESTIRIILADDHQLIREALRKMLSEQPEFEVVADVGDGRAAVRLAAELKAKVVVMDITMPGLNGLEATRQIKAADAQVQVVGLSMHADREFVTQMLAVGATGYVLKECSFTELIAAIRAVVKGEVYMSPKVAGLIVQGCLAQQAPAGKSRGGRLTPREREILQILADGKTSKEIAALLELSVKTVDTHRRQVMEKLNLHSIAELTHYAIREGVTALHGRMTL